VYQNLEPYHEEGFLMRSFIPGAPDITTSGDFSANA
jgi:hypothetical protein